MSDDDRQHLEALGEQHRANLRRLEIQEAKYPEGEVPLKLQNEMASERKRLAGVEGRLRALASSPQSSSPVPLPPQQASSTPPPSQQTGRGMLLLLGGIAVLVVLTIGVYLTLISRNSLGQQPTVDSTSLVPTTAIATADLERILRDANIPLSGGDDVQIQSVRQGVLADTGYAVLARNCLIVLAGRHLQIPVPLDVINKYYKLQVGRKEIDNLSLSEYNRLDVYPAAIVRAWRDVQGKEDAPSGIPPLDTIVSQ